MLNFIIKTHRVGTIYTKPHLFVLNKGMNSGKPQKEPFTNCFVVLFQNEEDCESLFFIAYSLWKTKFWHQFLCGSVIPFLRLPDFKKEFFPKAKIIPKVIDTIAVTIYIKKDKFNTFKIYISI